MDRFTRSSRCIPRLSSVSVRAEAIHEDVLRLPHVGNVPSRLGHRPGVHALPTWARWSWSAWRPAAQSTASSPPIFTGSAAIPAMVFARRLHDAILLRLEGAVRWPEYLKMRFDERVRGAQFDLVCGHDRLASGISMNALAKLLHSSSAGIMTSPSGSARASSALQRAQGRTDLRDLHRGAAILH